MVDENFSLTSPLMLYVKVTASAVELAIREDKSLMHCLRLAIGAKQHESLKLARETRTFSLKSVPSLSG